MNILVIGNGFDLAHGLPTTYTDFLEFCKRVVAIVDEDKKLDEVNFEKIHLRDWEIAKKIKTELKCLHICVIKGSFHDSLEQFYEIYWNIRNNIWIDYFLNNPMRKKNWIDFESEIAQIIQSIDNDMHSQIGKNITLEDKIQRFTNEFLNYKYIDWFNKKTYEELRDKLLRDLDALIRAFEIYLCEFIGKIYFQEKSPNIEALEIDHVLSFNYTNTYEKVYGYSKDVEYEYIHGKADVSNTRETNNMVLGIDEYLSKRRRNKEIEFIAFKKYYQRIYKQTGSEYKRWVEIIRNQIQEIDDKIKKQYPVQIPYNKIPNECRNQLFIFGHSLDKTDKDILSELILNDNIYTTIYYQDKKELGRKIANLLNVIGQDELIRRTGGSTKTIEFKQQQDMVEIRQ